MYEDNSEPAEVEIQETHEDTTNYCSGVVKAHERDLAAGSNVNYLSEIENHTNRLSMLLSELKSITDRACIAALKEAESADRIEESMESAIVTLRTQLEERDEDLQAKDEALKRNDKLWRAKFEQLEDGMRGKDAQWANRDNELKLARSEAEQLHTKLGQAELALQQTESQRRQFAERLEGEIAVLKLQLFSKEACLEEKERSLKRAEGELRAAIRDHQIRLRAAESKLAAVERECKHKESTIAAAALRESEIGKLIRRLSSECEKLTSELHEKSELIGRLEAKNHNFASGGKVWKKVIGLTQDQPL